jgi:hypothetical protein
VFLASEALLELEATAYLIAAAEPVPITTLSNTPAKRDHGHVAVGRTPPEQLGRA